MKTISFTATGMHCGSCELLIRSELEELKSVSDIQIDHKTGKGSVRIDGRSISTRAILAAIKEFPPRL